MDWLKQPDTLRQHMESPDFGGTFEQYCANKHFDLGLKTAALHRIYLDTKYWLHLRDVYRGQPRGSDDARLFESLKNLREANKILCPCLYSVLTELMYQSDKASRQSTAELIDLLSGGICVQPPHILFAIELDHWLHSVLFPQTELKDRNTLIWTKAIYFVGMPRLQCDALSPAQITAFEKASLDALWDISVVQLRETQKQRESDGRLAREYNANTLSSGKFDHHDDNKSFSDLYGDEVWGGLEMLDDQIQTIFKRLMQKTGFKGHSTENDLNLAGLVTRKLITAACKHRKLSTQLPQTHINASLHAALRLDKSRRYKLGDCEDFRHAGSALPYCELFLTERSLAHLLCNNPLQLDRDYNVTVISDISQAVDAVQRLASSA